MSDIQWKYAKNPHSGKTVSIDEANKLNKSTKFKHNYRCLDCDSQMTVKKGQIKRHHFSHCFTNYNMRSEGIIFKYNEIASLIYLYEVIHFMKRKIHNRKFIIDKIIYVLYRHFFFAQRHFMRGIIN